MKVYYNYFLCLAHKNVKAIWNHGGLLSTQEAVWEGIPLIVTPFFLDHKSNAKIILAKGIGIHLDFKILSTESVLHAIEEVLYNERYYIWPSILSIIYKRNNIITLNNV